MKKDERIVFVGPMGGGSIPTNGASVKNYHIAEKLRNQIKHLVIIDTERWKRNPFILIKLLFVLLFMPNAKLIFSLNNMSAYRVFSFLYFSHCKRVIYYWVIGGSISDWIKEGRVLKERYSIVHLFIVEGDSMKMKLNTCGFDNVIVVPNFKKIEYLPVKQPHGNQVRFVFLSRINPHKGCDYIFSACKQLSQQYNGLFEVDFYGEVAEDYTDFYDKIATTPNVSYKGFIDLRDAQNYDYLATYDAMLFPTFWHGEGFPGIMIDAFIAGLPVIASDWHLNKSIITDGITGIIVPPRDIDSLILAMEKCIARPSLIREMSFECQRQALKYDTDTVLNNELFHKLGLI